MTRTLRLFFGGLFLLGMVMAGMNFRDWNDREDARVDQAINAARLAGQNMTLARAHRQFEDMTIRAVKLAEHFMRENEVRAIVDFLKANADESLTVDLIMRIIYRESRWNPRAENESGAVGLCQIKPSSVGMTRVALLDPLTNVRAGIDYLKRLRTYYGGDLGLAIGHYAEGWTAGKTYARKILRGDRP